MPQTLRTNWMMNVTKTLYLLLVCVLVAGCSSKAVYDNVQRNNRQECVSVPPPQYDECIQRSSKSYEEYERDRSEVLKSEP
ncbi:MAG: hypothetical protein CMG79_19620 [Marinobacter sp.]|jgi:starvation-inducible outer membrane lipoprotein|uniref:Uncharacterized protein n=1 Tax=Marinobacter nauticus TaxID=2743 RepID=A0A3B8WG69_MARNT|nr:hypothetical protein [Marinobacter sp.]HAC28366.1 hypothetical protein [Marinobacter nauticus]HCL37021.1 hypothetical protein [Marinobacter nauticus]